MPRQVDKVVALAEGRLCVYASPSGIKVELEAIDAEQGVRDFKRSEELQLAQSRGFSGAGFLTSDDEGDEEGSLDDDDGSQPEMRVQLADLLLDALQVSDLAQTLLDRRVKRHGHTSFDGGETIPVDLLGDKSMLLSAQQQDVSWLPEATLSPRLSTASTRQQRTLELGAKSRKHHSHLATFLLLLNRLWRRTTKKFVRLLIVSMVTAVFAMSLLYFDNAEGSIVFASHYALMQAGARCLCG